MKTPIIGITGEYKCACGFSGRECVQRTYMCFHFERGKQKKAPPFIPTPEKKC